MNCRFWAAWTVAKVADLANTRVYELQNAIEFRNPQDADDDAGAA